MQKLVLLSAAFFFSSTSGSSRSTDETRTCKCGGAIHVAQIPSLVSVCSLDHLRQTHPDICLSDDCFLPATVYFVKIRYQFPAGSGVLCINISLLPAAVNIIVLYILSSSTNVVQGAFPIINPRLCASLTFPSPPRNYTCFKPPTLPNL